MKKILLGSILIWMAFSCANNTEEDPVPDAGLEVNNFTKFVDENPSNGQIIGSISASTTSGSLSFALVSQIPQGAIAVDESSGEITVADASLFIHAENPEITASVEVSNGTLTETVSVFIGINEPGGTSFTIWSGDKITFTKQAGSDPGSASNQDRITDNVWITRNNDGGPIFNIRTESSSNTGPAGTEWAIGAIDQVQSLDFQELKDALGGGRGGFKDLPGKTLVLHLLDDDIYLEVTFISWDQGKQGGFSYERATE